MDNKVTCLCDELSVISSFDSMNQYMKFAKNILYQLAKTEIRQIDIEKKEIGMDQVWFECTRCNKKWRLAIPDPPFGGFFEQIN